jgi:hypothetical protein
MFIHNFFFIGTQKIFFFSKNLCTNIVCLDVYAKFLFQFFWHFEIHFSIIGLFAPVSRIGYPGYSYYELRGMGVHKIAQCGFSSAHIASAAPTEGERVLTWLLTSRQIWKSSRRPPRNGSSRRTRAAAGAAPAGCAAVVPTGQVARGRRGHLPDHRPFPLRRGDPLLPPSFQGMSYAHL